MSYNLFMPDTNAAIHFLNGELITEKDLNISIRDLGFTRGYAVFDFLITYPHHRPFMLSKHIDRLFNSASLIGLSIPWSKEQISEWISKTLDANKDEAEKAIKIIISGGVADSLIPTATSTIAILVDPRHTFPQEYYEKGIAVVTAKHNRYEPLAKSNNYIEGVKQAQVAAQAGAIDPIYYDDQQVLESSTSNVFAVINNKLLTPKSNILPGITRGVLLSILKLDIPIAEEDFKLEDLLSAQEVFLSASNKEVMAVTKIDGKAVGDGTVGPITKEAMRQFKAFVLSNSWE